MTLLLALDTSTSTASVALFDGERVLSETTWLAGREHSTRLLVEVELAFERVGHRREELTGIVVARGPGSYTGVRVALGVAKGIAAGLGIPAWGVNSLDVLALTASPSDSPIRAILEAGRGRYATALYHADRCIEPPRIMTLAQVAEIMQTATLLMGELSHDARTTLSSNPHVRLAPHAASARRAAFAAELGVRQQQAGDPGDPAQLDAIYVS